MSNASSGLHIIYYAGLLNCVLGSLSKLNLIDWVRLKFNMVGLRLIWRICKYRGV